MLRESSLIILALLSTCVTDEHVGKSTCSASDGSGMGCASQAGKARQMLPASELLNLFYEPGMKSLKRAHNLVKQRRINLSEALSGVVDAYMNQDVRHLSMKQYKTRRRKILQILDDMLIAGADPNLVLRGRQLLQLAMEDGDIEFCRCLIKGGARLSDKGGFIYRWLAFLWGSTASVTDTVKGIMVMQEDVAAGKLEVLHLTTHDKYLNMFDVSASMRKLVVNPATSAALSDFSRSHILNILVDTLEEVLAEFISAVDFHSAVASGSRAADGRNVFHYLACAVPRSIWAFARAAVQAGAEAAKSTFHMLLEGNALGQTPFHLAAACTSTDQNNSRTFDALLTTAEELAAAAGINFESRGVFLAGLPQDKFGFSYLKNMASAEKVLNRSISSYPPASYNPELSGGWSVNGKAAERLDTFPPSRCDALVLSSPVSAKTFTQLVISSKPVLLRGEASRYKVRKRWKKKEFLKRHGDHIFDVSEIPYADVFGMKSEKLTVKDFVDKFAQISAGISSGAKASLYAFGADLIHQNPALRKDLESEPPILKGVVIDDERVSIASPQFYLGPPFSGAPMHFHKDAVNILAYGRKRWFLHPPVDAVYSKRPTAEWMMGIKNSSNSPEPWECVQEAGDVIYVPNGWAHATINIEESIGVAYEFESRSLSSFS